MRIIEHERRIHEIISNKLNKSKTHKKEEKRMRKKTRKKGIYKPTVKEILKANIEIIMLSIFVLAFSIMILYLVQ